MIIRSSYWIIGIFDESVDGQQSKVWLTLRVVNEVQVHQLFQLQVICGANMLG